jgi:hypothetical protein
VEAKIQELYDVGVFQYDQYVVPRDWIRKTSQPETSDEVLLAFIAQSPTHPQREVAPVNAFGDQVSQSRILVGP